MIRFYPLHLNIIMMLIMLSLLMMIMRGMMIKMMRMVMMALTTSQHQAKLTLSQSTQTPPATLWWGSWWSWSWWGIFIWSSWRWCWGRWRWRGYPVVRVSHPRESSPRKLLVKRGLFHDKWVIVTVRILTQRGLPGSRIPSCFSRTRLPPHQGFH